MFDLIKKGSLVEKINNKYKELDFLDNLEVMLLRQIKGVTKQFDSLEKKERCTECYGKGYTRSLLNGHTATCSLCGGSGEKKTDTDEKTQKEIELAELIEAQQCSLLNELRRLWPEMNDDEIIRAAHKYIANIDDQFKARRSMAIRELTQVEYKNSLEDIKASIEAAKYYISYLI